MHIKPQDRSYDLDNLTENTFWSKSAGKEINLHKIHAYPAKFPSLLVSKSFEYAKENGFNVKTVGDVFCGCGTTALEAKIHGVNFWGCDINPVATLIARTKSSTYDDERVHKYLKKIVQYSKIHKPEIEPVDNERIHYWFRDEEIIELQAILEAINTIVKNKKYKDFFLCAFSNILKKCSMWLTKSIKPQMDRNKIPATPIDTFVQQVMFMIKANSEFKSSQTQSSNTYSKIITSNFLSLKFPEPFLDLLVTSPPYAVSYEYADLHQLSALWLGYANDYRDLRAGSIGSTHNIEITENEVMPKLNRIGVETYRSLLKKDFSKAKSVAKYFLDLEMTVKQSKRILKKNSLAVFVIGDTKYKGVDVSNSSFLIKSLFENGFKDVWVYKRKITSKNLTPYRDSKGRFSSCSRKRHVYSHEYIIVTTF